MPRSAPGAHPCHTPWLQVYTGGKHTDRIAADIETALTRRDEFGRVMTPKEAFRALCYKYVRRRF